MDFLLSRYRNMTALLLVILAQLVLLAWQVKSSQDVRLIRVWAVTAVTPLARVLEFVREHTIGVAENYFVLVSVREENRRLKDELGRAKMDNQFLRNELSTADRAHALQAFQQRTPSRTLPARIIGTGTGANARVVFIDQGSSAGVMRGMAVVTPDGIVGKVLAAYPTASQVQLITDGTFAAGVISEKNRVHGTVKGAGQSKVTVEYVQNEEQVEVGEMFYTSGDDRVFPKGMPVGRVTVVRPGTNFKEIFLVPIGFQQGLEEVLIVVEGVHGQIPDSSTASAPGVYLMPPPDPAKPAAPAAPTTDPSKPGTSPAEAPPAPALSTDADKLKERYKRIGEAQGHTFGEGAGRVPNFNLNPDAAKPAPAPNRTSGTPPTQSTAPAGGPANPPAQPSTAQPGGAAASPQTNTAPPTRQTPANGNTARPQTNQNAPVQNGAERTGASGAPPRTTTSPPNRSTVVVPSVPVPTRTEPPASGEQRPARPPQ